jgi:hypothetical protein
MAGDDFFFFFYPALVSLKLLTNIFCTLKHSLRVILKYINLSGHVGLVLFSHWGSMVF